MICDGAMAIFDVNLPDIKTKRQGTELGRAVVNSPRGSAIIERFRKHVCNLHTTRDRLKPVWTALDDLSRVSAAINFLSCPDDIIVSVKDAISTLVRVLVVPHDDVVQEFMPSSGEPAVEDTLSAFLDAVYAAFKAVSKLQNMYFRIPPQKYRIPQR